MDTPIKWITVWSNESVEIRTVWSKPTAQLKQLFGLDKLTATVEITLQLKLINTSIRQAVLKHLDHNTCNAGNRGIATCGNATCGNRGKLHMWQQR